MSQFCVISLLLYVTSNYLRGGLDYSCLSSCNNLKFVDVSAWSISANCFYVKELPQYVSISGHIANCTKKVPAVSVVVMTV